jgi:hypothetical protein
MTPVQYASRRELPGILKVWTCKHAAQLRFHSYSPETVILDLVCYPGAGQISFGVLQLRPPPPVCFPGVVYSHRATYVHTLAMCMPDSVNLAGFDVVLPVVPYFHANGWGIPYAGNCACLPTSTFTQLQLTKYHSLLVPRTRPAHTAILCLLP